MKALGLLSGGLDSELATKLILDQGIEVIGIHFDNIFCSSIVKRPETTKAKKSAIELGISFKEFDVTQELFEIVKDPAHGHGSGLNPCIDCKILFFKKAKEYMNEVGAKFIITGEVLGQRPMSQHREAMEIIEKESGLSGLIIRPLSAKLLEPSIPEMEGWIDRRQLLNHSGRSRKVQYSLAEKYGFKEFSAPAGGCLLAEPGYSKRMKESFNHGEDSIPEIELLQIGRHFRLCGKAKLIVGRNQIENEILTKLIKNGDIIIEPVNTTGPTSIIPAKESYNPEDYTDLALKITTKYCGEDATLRFGKKLNNEILWIKEQHIKLQESIIENNDITHII